MKKLFLALISTALFSCSGDDSATPTPVTPTPSNSITFFNSKIDNTSVIFNEDSSLNPTHYHDLYVGYTNGNGFERVYTYGCSMVKNDTDFIPSLELSFDNMYTTDEPTQETANFYSNFQTNTPTNFITSAQESSLIKGISVNYTPTAGGSTYSTKNGSQSGSTITYTSITTGTNSNTGEKIVTITGTLNCKLYDSNVVPEVKTLTNGSFKLIFNEFN
jgi:hypothetical protein